MNARIFLLGLVLAGSVTGFVQAADTTTGSTIMVDKAWIRSGPPDAPVRAGYGLLMNHGEAEVVIDGVRSDAFGSIEIHEMHEVDGVMRMRPVKQLRLPPHGSIALEPGGMHLMLFRPTAAWSADAGADLVFLHGDTVLTRTHFVVADGDPAGAGAHHHEHDAHHEHRHEHRHEHMHEHGD